MRNFRVKSKEINEHLVLLYRISLLMAFYSLCRILFYSFNTLSFPKVIFLSFLEIMKAGLFFDIQAILYLNVVYAIFFLLPFRFRFANWYQHFLKLVFMIGNGLGLAFNLIDIIYYRYILKRITASSIDIAAFDAGNIKLIFRFIHDFWYIAFMLIVLLFALSILYSVFKPKPVAGRNSLIFFLSGTVLLFGFIFLAERGIDRKSPLSNGFPVFYRNFAFLNAPEELSLVQNTPFSMISTLGKKDFGSKSYFRSEEETSRIFNPVHVPASGEPMRKDNVVIIILESFGKAFVGSLNPQFSDPRDRSYTPFLDSLMSQGLICTNAFANGRKSIDGIPAITASIPELIVPYTVTECKENKINSLASLLVAEGYQSAFYHAAPNGTMGFNVFTKMAGYQKYSGLNEYPDRVEFDGVWGIWDEAYFQYFARQINDMKEPFLGTIFSVSSHHPYQIPEKYKDRFPEGRISLDKCIRYTDHSLQKFFDTARKMPWYKNTLFVISADHAINSAIPEYYSSTKYFSIPILFYKPDGSLKGVDDQLVQQTDIMPSILNYLNYPSPYVSFGNSVFDPLAKRFVLNYLEESYQFLSGDYALYLTNDKLTNIYNRKDDPQLRHNLVGKITLPEEEQRMKAVIQQYMNRMVENRMIVGK